MDELQIILAIAVLYATYRWYSSSSSSSSTSASTTSSSGTGSSSNPAQRFVSLSESIPNDAFTQVQAMFPQMSEREIRWEFVRTGRVRNLDAVVQDLLEGRQTIIPTGFLDPVAPPPSTASSSNAPALQKARYDSLITKLKLQDQVKQQDAELAGDSTASGKGKGTERSISEEWKGLSLQEKKERMVLAARRSIIEKDNNAKRATTHIAQ